MTESCVRLWEVDALREGHLSARDADSFARHRETCEVCRQRFIDDEVLRAMGRALYPRVVDPFHARRLRQGIMRRAAAGEERTQVRSSRLALIVGTFVFALLSIIASLTLRSSAPQVDARDRAFVTRAFGATIDARQGSLWTTATEGSTERVTLRAGSLTLEVRHREPGERFFVELPDGEIEVRGTRFTVEVSGSVTVGVRVMEGLVALRRTGSHEVFLGAGESWPQTVSLTSATAAPSKSVPNVGRSRKPSLRPVPVRALQATVDASVADTSSYEAAVELFAAHDYDEAARALHAYASAHGDRPEAEDAEFLEASALAGSGRFDAASIVAERFLDHYPRSLHASAAATLAVRGARDRDDCARARGLASRWIRDEHARHEALGACTEM